MNWSILIRQVHRSTSIAFTVAFIAVNILGFTQAQPEFWIYLPPLGLLLLSSLYMVVLPYIAKWRNRREASAEERIS